MISPSGSSIVPKVVFLNISVSFFNEVKYRSSVKPFIVRVWNLVPMEPYLKAFRISLLIVVSFTAEYTCVVLML